ncbi:hypothetical protein PQX77_009945 [Marasmius sp. AFHP31]|nr:hypothetical protein PQX77_009945 [Marasmius sp. AFHP31]
MTFLVVIETCIQVKEAALLSSVRESREFVEVWKHGCEDAGVLVQISIVRFLAALMNILAEVVLIHRCYVIRNSRRRIIAPFIVAATVMRGIELSTVIITIKAWPQCTDARKKALYLLAYNLDLAVSVCSAIFDLGVTLWTAAKIRAVRLQARDLQGSSQIDYSAVILIILQSGMIYPIAEVGLVIVQRVFDPYANGKAPVDLGTLVTAAAGIAPTLIILRGGLGRGTTSVDEAISSINFEVREVEMEMPEPLEAAASS